MLSRGFICPKGVALRDLHEDPERLRAPLVRRGHRFVEVSWDDAFAEVAARLPPIVAAHGKDAVARGVGNPAGHKLGLLLYTAPLEGKHFVDGSGNADYQYFVVIAWLPIYAIIYIAPHVL